MSSRFVVHMLVSATLIGGVTCGNARAAPGVAVAVASRAPASTAKQTQTLALPTLRSWLHRFNPGHARIVHLGTEVGKSLAGQTLRGSRSFGVVRASTTEAADTGRAVFAAPRRLLLDEARQRVGVQDRAAVLQSVYGSNVPGRASATGSGVYIGFVDSGADLTHPDFRLATGETRVAWHLDFAEGPHGFYPELEEELGCASNVGSRCGVLGRPEVQQLIDGESLVSPLGRQVFLPEDRVGHGTHVASIAAASGESDGRFEGIAPESELMIVRAAGTDAVVTDPDVLLASRFLFERAEAAGSPAVVNLSLGGDFGPHDGSAFLARALVELTEAKPGRVVVVAAGNSGSLVGEAELADRLGAEVEGPFGIHTDAFLEPEQERRIPLLFPTTTGPSLGTVLVWIAARPGNALTVALESSAGETLLEPVLSGEVGTASSEQLEVVVVNQRQQVVANLVPGLDVVEDLFHPTGTALLMSGIFESEDVLHLRLKGEGVVRLWVQAEGGVGPGATEHGVLFPRASIAETVNIPATSSGLIAVGATLNRLSWDSPGGTVDFSLDLLGQNGGDGSLAVFGSAGPNLLGRTKPDVVAPGIAVAGALSRTAQPVLSSGAPNLFSVFADSPLCISASDCALAGEQHAVSAGTSMAAPLVSGAAALLLEQDPTLTQAEILNLLRAGAGEVGEERGEKERAGAGELQVLRTSAGVGERLATRAAATGVATRDQSRLTIAAPFLRPDENWTVEGLIHLKNLAGEPVSPSPDELELRVTRGRISQPLQLTGFGLYAFGIAADDNARGQQVQIRLLQQGDLVAEQEVRVARTFFDVGPAADTGCDCEVGLGSSGGSHHTVVALVLGLAALGRQRRSRFGEHQAKKS